MNTSKSNSRFRKKTAQIFVEGGGPNDANQAPCRKGFRILFEKCGYEPRSFQINACGGRDATAKDFKIAHDKALKQYKASHGAEDLAYIAMLVDSEDPVVDITKPCAHLNARAVDKCDCPADANDDQVFLMTTCMETWIVADRAALQGHYHADQSGKVKRPKQDQVITKSMLPSLNGLEKQNRHEVHDKLENATAHCSNGFKKGARSFELLGKIDHCTLMKNLASFKRMIEILDLKLGGQHSPCPGEGVDTINDSH